MMPRSRSRRRRRSAARTVFLQESPHSGATVSCSLAVAESVRQQVELQRVRLFCVGGPEGSRRGCERHGKSYLTLRRRGEAGDGGGSLTGGAIPSA